MAILLACMVAVAGLLVFLRRLGRSPVAVPTVSAQASLATPPTSSSPDSVTTTAQAEPGSGTPAEVETAAPDVGTPAAPATGGPAGTKPDRPSGVSLQVVQPGVLRVAWSPATAPVLGFHLYTSVVSGRAYIRVNDLPIKVESARLRDLERGQTYYVVVTAVSPSGEESERSEEVKAAP